MDKNKGLLARACDGIMDLDRPACIKDGQLRHVAVNAAYVRFFGRPADEIVGKTASQAGIVTHDPEGDELRADKERRALVFATEETAIYVAPVSGARHVAGIERFSDENEDLYLFCKFEQPVADTAVTERDIEAVISSGALDLIDVGISIYDRNDILLYCNETLRAFYAVAGLDLRPGMALREIMEHMYEVMTSSCKNDSQGRAIDIEAWVNSLLELYRSPSYEAVEPLMDGRWLRLVNRRLDNGILIGLRVDVTNYVTQEAGLRENLRETELLRAAMERLPVAVFMRDSARRLTYANAAYERMMGRDRPLYMGKTEQEMFPDSDGRFQEENSRILDSGESLEKNELVPMPGGESLPVITRLGRIATASGENYIIGSIVDISLLKERENELEAARGEAEKLHLYLESILAAMPVGILIFGSDRRIEYVNSAYKVMWNDIASGPVIGVHIRDFMEMNYRKGYYDHLEMDFESVYRTRMESLLTGRGDNPIEFVNADGRVIAVTSKRLPGDRIFVTYVDITEIREREQEASRARAELERVGQYMQDASQVMAQGLAVIEDGKFIMANESLWRMLDMPSELCQPGAPWLKSFEFCLVRGDFGDRDETAGMITTVKSNIEERRSFSTSFRVAGKTWLQMESTVSARGHWLVVITDVTEMKQREAELTRLLTRAEAADRAKSEFLANMSHEIRTPMNGVLGMAELLARSPLDTRQKTFTDIIVKSGNALLTIINDILDFSRIDAGQMKLRQAPFDPVDAVEDVVALLSSTASQRDVELLVRSDPAICRLIVGDAGRFRQIVTNLVGNAIKFTERGHVIIDLSTEDAEEGEVLLGLRVEDSGIGIPAERLGSIFDKFSQVDSSSTRRHEGTGLGLAITAGLVSLFSGWIGVESEINKGSVFSVRLPMRRAPRQQAGLVLPASVRGAHVLIIDDCAANRDILCGQLSSWGFDCHAVEDGASGIAMLEAALEMNVAVDAVILDSHISGDAGFDVARTIRSERRFDDIAIIVLTNIDMAGDDDILVSLDIQGHLMKPVRAALLHSTLGDVIRVRRARQIARVPVSHEVEEVAAALQPLRALPGVDDLAPAPRTSRKGSLDVLVAEDNDVNQIVFTQILQSTGLTFRIVDNGRKAVDVWLTERPAVILMDVSMPVMNGHQAARSIREHEKVEGGGKRVPIIGVTAHALESDREECFAAGMDDYLAKPISPELLESKISRWLGRAMPERNTTAG